MEAQVLGLVALMILLADAAAVLSVVTYGGDIRVRALWITVILALPLVGLMLWLVAGPRATRLAI